MRTPSIRLTKGLLLLCGLSAGACHRPATEGSAPPPASTEPRPLNRTDANAAAPRATETEAGTPPPAVTPIAPPAAAAAFHDAGRFLAQGEVGPWRQSGPVTHSTAARLSELIDGGAAAFQAYGLTQFARSDYRRAGSSLSVTVEAYQFQAPLGAFGYFSQMLANGRDPSTMQARAAQRGVAGFQSDTQLVFWAGNVLMQVTMGDTSDEPSESALVAAARESLPVFGAALERLVPPERTAPVSPLPAANLVWGGNTFLADEAFGVREVGPSWVGHYRAAEQRYRLALFTRANAPDAARVLVRLRGAGPTPVPGVGDEAFTAHTPAQGDVLVVRRGPLVLAVGDPVAEGAATALAPAARLAIARAALAALPTL